MAIKEAKGEVAKTVRQTVGHSIFWITFVVIALMLLGNDTNMGMLLLCVAATIGSVIATSGIPKGLRTIVRLVLVGVIVAGYLGNGIVTALVNGGHETRETVGRQMAEYGVWNAVTGRVNETPCGTGEAILLGSEREAEFVLSANCAESPFFVKDKQFRQMTVQVNRGPILTDIGLDSGGRITDAVYDPTGQVASNHISPRNPDGSIDYIKSIRVKRTAVTPPGPVTIQVTQYR